VLRALETHADYVASETLAVTVTAAETEDDEWRLAVQDVDLDGPSVRIGVRRA
jgi:hypothetical protein